MTVVEQHGQLAAGSVEFEREVESVKVERNTKGWNYSFRVARHEGESWEDVFRTVDMVHSALVRRYGDNR